MPKTLKEHLTVPEIIKIIFAIGAAFGLTSVTSDQTPLQERVAIIETRIDPIDGTMSDILEQIKKLNDKIDALNIELKVHEARDDR